MFSDGATGLGFQRACLVWRRLLPSTTRRSLGRTRSWIRRKWNRKKSASLGEFILEMHWVHLAHWEPCFHVKSRLVPTRSNVVWFSAAFLVREKGVDLLGRARFGRPVWVEYSSIPNPTFCSSGHRLFCSISIPLIVSKVDWLRPMFWTEGLLTWLTCNVLEPYPFCKKRAHASFVGKIKIKTPKQTWIC